MVQVDTSNNRTTWTEAGRLRSVHGPRSYLPLRDGSSRFIRLRFSSGAAGRTAASSKFAVREINVRPLEFASSPTALLRSIAQDSPRGMFPRAYHDEQTYWSVLGVSGGNSEALFSEDGQLEIAKRGPSLEPFITTGNRVITWADGVTSQSLLDGVRPIPSVTRRVGNISLVITALAAGTPTSASSYVRYRIINHSREPLTGMFWVALRPLQVNPPWQFPKHSRRRSANRFAPLGWGACFK